MANDHTPKTFTKTVGELINESINGKINPNPIGQRPPVSEGWGKSKGIIESLIKGYSVGLITLRNIITDEKNKKVYKGTDYLVIDGGHRIRAIIGFYKGKFDVNGLRFVDLPEEVQDAFLEKKISIDEYVVNNKQATEIFRRLNTVTPVNTMEMIMSNDTSEFAKQIRSRVKYYSEYDNKVHPLFNVRAVNGKPPKPDNWASDANPRRKWDEFVAIVMTKVIGEGNVNASLETIEKEVEDDIELSSKTLKTVDKFLNDALKIKKSVNKKFNTDTFAAFQVVWFGLLEQYNFKIEDYDKFSKEFFIAHSFLTGNNANKFDTEIREFKTNVNKKENKIVKEFARRAIKNFANETQQKEVAKLYLEQMELSGIMTILEKKRTVSRDKKFDMLASQGFVCAIDSLPLDIDDAIFGHDTPWSKGGRIEEGAIIRKEHNVDMGTMTISEYKAYLEFKRVHNEMTASA